MAVNSSSPPPSIVFSFGAKEDFTRWRRRRRQSHLLRFVCFSRRKRQSTCSHLLHRHLLSSWAPLSACSLWAPFCHASEDKLTHWLSVWLTDWLVGCSNSLSRTAPSSCAVQFKSFTTLFTVAPLVISPLCVCVCVINCVRRQRRQQQHSVTFFSLCEFVQETRQRAKVALASSPQPVHLLHLVDKGERGREGDRRRKPKKKVNSVPLFSLTPFAFVPMWILSHLTLNWWTDWCYHHHHYCCWPWTQPPWPPQ